MEIDGAPPAAVEQAPPDAVEQAPPDAVEQVPPKNDVDGDVAETLLLLRLDTPPGHFTSNSRFTSTCALLGCCIQNPGAAGSYCCKGHSELAVLWSSWTLRAYHVYYGYANKVMRDEISCTIVILKEGGIDVGVPTLETGKVFDVVPWENDTVFRLDLREGERNRDWFFFAAPPAANFAMTNDSNHNIKWHLNPRKARTFDEKEVFVTLGTLAVENNPEEKERRKVWRLYWYQRGAVSLYCLSYIAQNVVVPKLGAKTPKPKRDDKKPDDDMEEEVKSKDLKSKDPNCSAKGKRRQKNTGELGKGIALGHVHGVLHRDVKPHTFLMDPKTMRLKIADDLGLARAFTLPMQKYTLEVNAALKACTDSKLDALVIIEACTNLFQLVGVLATTNGDLKNQFVEPNVGFDTVCKGTTVRVELGDGTTVAKAGDAHIIARSFPHTLGQPLAHFLRANSKVPDAKIIIEHPAIRVEIVFSGRQAPGGRNVIWGLYEALKVHNSKNSLLGFSGGSEGLFAQKTLEITDDVLQTYKNQGGFDLLGRTKDQIRTTEQVNAALKACTDLKLDALVIIGDAAHLAEAKCPTKLVGVPVTVNGDLKNQFVEPNVGIDTICKGTTVCVELGDGTTVAKAGDAHIIACSFPHTLGQPLAHFLRANSKVPDAKIIIEHPAIRVGIVLSGRQAPGGHNVIWGVYETLKVHNSKNTLLGFLGGSEGLFAQKTLEITDDVLQTYKNQGGFDLLGRTKDQIRTTEQVNAALKACTDLKLDALVIIGGNSWTA